MQNKKRIAIGRYPFGVVRQIRAEEGDLVIDQQIEFVTISMIPCYTGISLNPLSRTVYSAKAGKSVVLHLLI